MQKPAEYRRHAAECRKLTMGAMSDENRARLLHMAETWEQLAAAREELLSRHPELDKSSPAPAEDPVEDTNMPAYQIPEIKSVGSGGNPRG
jgi:hypothetical protein